MTVDAIQLSKDIVESRQRTIEYNERVLSGILCASEYYEHIQYLKAIELRVLQWRQEWK
jgi:hypothetical protein